LLVAAQIILATIASSPTLVSGDDSATQQPRFLLEWGQKGSENGEFDFPIGIAINGVAIFGPQNAEGQDAVMVEMFDQCGGHPDPRGVYHYHRMPDCLVTEQSGKHSAVIGVAFDGFLIYGKLGSNGKAPLDLDACNGHVGPTTEFPSGAYHYHATTKFPYLLGCYAGTPSLPRRPDRPPEFGRPGSR